MSAVSFFFYLLCVSHFLTTVGSKGETGPLRKTGFVTSQPYWPFTAVEVNLPTTADIGDVHL